MPSGNIQAYPAGALAGASLPVSPARSALVSWLVIALIPVVSLAMQLSVYPNHDVAWVLWGAREMLGGAIWGGDIIEPNPPLAWYLAMPAAWLAKATGAPIAAVFQVIVAGAAMVSLAVFDRLIRPQVQSPLPTIVAALFLFLLPYRDFGQREHLLLIGALPYVALAAARQSGAGFPRVAALAVGVAAGLAFALKPYFLGVPLLVEATLLVATRYWRSVIRLETVAMGAVIAAYGVYVLLFVPEYLRTVVPLAQSIYWSFDAPLGRVLAPLLVPVMALGLTLAMVRPWPRALPLLLSAATGGCLLSCVLQHKGYSYHILPVTAGAAITLAVAWSDATLSPRLRLAASLMMVVLLFQPVVATSQWWRLNGPGGANYVGQRRIVDTVDRYAGGGRFLVVAVHPLPAFPTALYARASQVSRTNSQWFLPAVVQLRSGRAEPFPGALASAERNARAFILDGLSRHPDLVIIDTDSARHTVSRPDFDFLSFYQEDPRFRAAWAPYREVQPLYGYRLFVRAGGLHG